MGRPSRRFTIYDMMEDRGVFDNNPANISARDSNGMNIYKRADYPRMLYHPEGKERVTVPAVAIATPFGPQWVGEQKQLIDKIVNSKEEEEKALAEGWHRTPMMAMQARAKAEGREFVMADNPVDAMGLEKENENALLRKQLAELSAKNAELENGLAELSKPKK